MNMKTSPNDVSNNEILKELKRLTVSDAEIKNELKSLSNKIDVVHEETMETIYELSKHTDARFDRLEGRVGFVEAKMVTKGYLDDKMADLRSDLSQNTRRQIEKALG